MAKKLTDRACRAAAPGDKRREVLDAGLPGLSPIIQPSGSKSWQVRWRDAAGRSKRTTLGRFPALTTEAARGLARTAMATIAEGYDAGEVRRGNVEDRERHTVAAAWADFDRRHITENLRASSARDYRSIWRTHIEPAWSDRDVRDLGRRDVADFLDRLGDKGAGARRANIARCLSAFLGWTARRGTIEHNPCTHVPAPVKITRRDRVLTDAEICGYWKAASEFGPGVSALLRILVLMPLRLGELANLRWDEVRGDVLEIGADRLKGGVSRTIPLPAAVRAMIAELPRDGAHVFSTTAGRTRISGHSKIKAKLDQLMTAELGAEVPAWRVHDIRRTGASGMRMLGTAPDVIHKVLGHSASTGSHGVLGQVYLRTDLMDEQRAALEAWNAHVATITAPDGVVPVTGRR